MHEQDAWTSTEILVNRQKVTRLFLNHLQHQTKKLYQVFVSCMPDNHE